MKNLIAGVLCLFACCVFSADPLKVGDNVQIVRDLRAVNGSRVDLTPVRWWFKRGQQGERPLRAWRRFHVIQVKGIEASFQRCIVKNEAGEAEEILVMHFPYAIQAYVERVNKLKTDIDTLTKAVDVEEKRVREADAVTPIAVGGARIYVNEQMDRRYDVNLAAARLTEDKKKLAQMQAEREEMIRTAEDFTDLLIMPTGKKWANTDLWEHGTSLNR